MTGFDNIRVKSPYSIKIIEVIKIECRPNEHARLYLRGIVDEAVNFNTAINASSGDEVHVYEIGGQQDKTIFKGLVAGVKTTNINGVYSIELEGISGSFQLDVKKKSRSFQDTGLDYPALVKEIIKEYPGHNFINSIGGGVKTGAPVFQYKETDWELVRRLASHFYSVIVSDILENGPRFYFGLPTAGKSHTLSDNIPYTAHKDIGAFKKAGGSAAGLHDTDFFYYEIQSPEQYAIGDEVWFREKQFFVSRISACIDRGVLKYKYRLSRQQGIRENKIYNAALKGVSLEGRILDVKDELVKLHLDIDKDQAKSRAYWFPFAPSTNNVMYCMPQKGTNATLYFPDASGEGAKVVGCVRKNGDSCPKTGDPTIRYFGTEHGSELELSPSAINIVAGCKEPLKLSFDDATGVTMTSHKKLLLMAAEEISLSTPKRITISAQSQIFARKGSASSGFSIESEYHFLSDLVIADGSDRTSYPKFQDEPKKGKKPGFNWGKLIGNVLGALAVVAVVTAVAALTVVTLGAGAVVVGAVVAGAAIAGTAAVASVAVGDVMRGEVSDFSVYAGAAAREATIGAISGAVFGPFGAAETLGGKMALGAVTNVFESCIRQTMEGKSIDPLTLLLDGGIGAFTGGLFHGAGKVAPWIKKGANKLLGKAESEVAEEAGEKLLKEAEEKALKEAEEEVEERAAKKGIPEKRQVCEGDPINVVTGSHYLKAVDLVVEDRGINVEIQRRYNSADGRNGVMGRCWFFEYESHVERSGKNAVSLYYPDGHIEKFIKENGEWKKKESGGEPERLTEDSITGSFILCLKGGTQYTYGENGKLLAISDRNGNAITLCYTPEGLIEKIESPGGKVFSFKHNNGRIAEITDGIGRKLLYQYEGELLKKVTLPNKGVFKYNYENGFLTSITDMNGRSYVKNEYDGKGRVTRQYVYPDKDGEAGRISVTDIRYDEKEAQTVFDCVTTGQVKIFKYNRNTRYVTEIIHPDGTSESYTYDQYGNKTSETDRNGRTIRRVWDSAGNLLEEKYPGGSTLWNEYDEAGNLVRTHTSGGWEALYAYDAKGNLIEEKVKLDEKEYAATAYTYDSYGRMLSRTDPENNTTLYEYGLKHVQKPTTVKDPGGNGFKYGYDEAGRLISITTSYGTVEIGYNAINKKTWIKDAKGGVTLMAYDRMGNLIEKIMPNEYRQGSYAGNGYEYRYDAMDRLIRTTDPLGGVFAVKYDVDGNLVKEIHPSFYDRKTLDGAGIEYTYDTNGRKVKTIYPTGGTARTKYDAAGNIIKTIAPGKYDGEADDGPGTVYEYDEMNRLIKITDPDGNVVKKLQYDAHGRKIAETGAKGYRTLFKYNAAGWLLEKREPVEDEAGEILYYVTEYGYDKAVNLTLEKRSPHKVRENEIPELWNAIRYTYDKNNRVIKISDTTGAQIEYAYDCLNNRMLEKVRINDTTCKTTHYRYDSIGRLEKKIEEIDGSDLAVKVKGKTLAQTVYEYDKNGNIIRVAMPAGSCRLMEYDAADRLIKVTAIDTDGTERATAYRYDKAGNLVKETDCNGNSLRYEYDAMNRRTRITDREGRVTRLYYDAAGNIIKHVKPQNYDEARDDGDGTTFRYDNMNRLLEIENELGHVIRKNRYNAAGELVERAEAAQRGTTYAYDIAGRVTQIFTPGAAQKGRPSQKYTYDAFGNITGITDGEGNTTSHCLDLWGRVTEVIKADGSREKYQYDYAGNITSATDGNSSTTHYAYNSLNLLSQIQDPAGNVIDYKYDMQGRVAQKTDRNGRVLEYAYNMDNSLVLRKETATGISEQYRYNSDGTLLAAVSGDTVYNYAYTPDLDLKSKSINGKTALQYRYGKHGKITELKDLTGRQIRYTYDKLGRLEAVWEGNKKAADYTYNIDGTLVGIDYSNGISARYTYDGDKNLTGIIARNAKGEEIINHCYAYDNNGNQLERLENGRRTQYTYDSLNRLAKAVYPDTEETFAYDAAGNRTHRSSGGTGTSYFYDLHNRLLEKMEGGEQTRYAYDPQGNLLEESGKIGTVRYTYDCFNRTAEVYKHDGSYIRNRYDAEGLRHEINENGSISRFVFDGGNVLAELDSTGDIRASVLRGHKLLSQKDSAGNDYFYLSNAHGDVTHLSDMAGNVVNSYRYDAFGNTIEAAEQVQNRFRYAGEQFDAVTGQYYLRARFYNPVVGRFTQEDVYRGDGLNLYAYVANNPIKYIDPSGYWGHLVHEEITKQIAKKVLGNANYAEIVGKACIGVDKDIRTSPFLAITQGWHFNKSPDPNLDSRMLHFEEFYQKAVDTWNNAASEAEREEAMRHLGKSIHPLQDIDAHMDWDTGPLGLKVHQASSGYNKIKIFDDPQYDLKYNPETGGYDPIDSGEKLGSQRYKNTEMKTRNVLEQFKEDTGFDMGKCK